MTHDMRERIADILDQYSVHVEEGHSLDYVATAIIAELPDMVPELVWECTGWSSGDGVEGENDDTWESSATFGHSYLIEWAGNTVFLVSTPDHRSLVADSFKAAKAAANAHHRAQIMKALGIGATHD